MSNHRRTLDELIDDLPEGILDQSKIEAKPRAARGSRHAFFDEINAFIDAHGREPDPAAEPGSDERRLGLHLKGARKDPDLAAELREIDRHQLLIPQNKDKSEAPASGLAPVADVGAETKNTQLSVEPQAQSGGELTSLDDVLGDEELMRFLNIGAEADDVFDMTHVEANTGSRAAPDEIAEREPCEDFEIFEPLFQRMRQRIKDGIATVEPFHREGQIEVGDYFYLRGQMCLVDDIEDTEIREGGEAVYRVRVIFDNGTQMRPYKHSLGRALLGQKSRGYERGQRIIDPDVFTDRFNGISHRDQSKGFIYVLRSKRQDVAIREQRDLYKVGLTARSIEDRLQGAENQTTYLEGPVELIAEWEIYGANLRKVEKLLHAFLSPRRAAFTLIGADGRQYHPREWFNVPFATIKQAAERIIDGSLMDYRLNPTTGEILRVGESPRLDDRDV